MKRFIAVLFMILLLAGAALVPAATAAETTQPTYIYFEVPTQGVAWNNFKRVFCHIWSKTGGDIYSWQAKEETCEDMGNGYWRYDLSGISFDPEGEYSLIFSNENGMQTYNLNITAACMGDIAYCKGDTCVNPVDGEKSCAVARWRHHGDKVHPAIEVDSNGKTLNVDEVNAAEIDTVWGTAEGSSYELPALATEAPTEQSTAARTGDGEIVEDNINTNVATIWIVSGCALVFISVIVIVVILAKKNKGEK